MTLHRATGVTWKRIAATIFMAVGILAFAQPSLGQDCWSIRGLLRDGRPTRQISRLTGLTPVAVEACRRELSQPIFVGPEGAPPVRAVGPAPRRAAGPPPLGAAGPPPIGAAGPPPIGRSVQPLR